MKLMTWVLLTSGLLFLATLSFAQEDLRSPDSIPVNGGGNAEKVVALPPGVIEKVYEGSTTLDRAVQARRSIIDEAIAKVSEELIQSILGEKRYKKNKKVITDKIFRQASRYIPVIKAGDLQKTADGKQSLAVTLQINSKVLETLLQEQGLLYDNESAPMMIPFISINDQVRGGAYRWWKEENSSNLNGMWEFLENQFQKSLFSLGFYVQRPEASMMRLMLPKGYQADVLTTEQVQSLAQRWNIPLATTGDLVISKDAKGDIVFNLRLFVTQVNTGRVLAQLYRQNKLSQKENLENLNFKRGLGFVTEAYRDLGQQMLEAWQRGILSSTLVRLEVQGGLPIGKYELFKETLKSANRSIRQVRERMISSQSVLFELEINGAIGDLTSSLNQVTVDELRYQLKGVDAQNTLVLVPEKR